MSKLRFAVARCSGEDPAFPARELNEHAAASRGFMTPRNCEYPQELVLQLADGLCRLTQVQLLSHQTHIATKIELFLSKDAALEDAQFQRLGYLTLKSNVESNYMARELKTVHIDNQAAWVRLVLHQCYVNERNIYSQVGIMAVNLCGERLEVPQQQDELPSQSTGEMLGSPSRSPNPRSVPKPQATPGGNGGAAGGNSADDLSFDLRFDAKTAARIREIQAAKDQAVAMEDYDQAKRLKHMEEQLKSIGLQLTRLEAQKREAVANEDYDLAKHIKDEISMLEATVDSNETMPILPLPSASMRSTGSSVSVASPFPSGSSSSPLGPGTRATASSRSQVLPRAGAAAIAGTKGGAVSAPSASSSFSPRDMYPEDSAPAPKRSGGAYRPAPGRRQAEEDDEESPNGRRRPNDGRNYYQDEEEDEEEEQGGGGSAQEALRGIPEAENLPEPDEIPPALAKESETMIGVIGEYLTRCFYSNLWNHRDAAIRKVAMDLDAFRADQMLVLEVCSTLVQSGAGDRIAQVALSAFRLLDRMMAFGSRVRRDDMCHILGNSMTQLVSKLGDPQTKVRDEAAAALLRLATTKNVGVAFVSAQVLKRPKKPLALKLLLGRLQLVKELIADCPLSSDSDHSVAGIMGFLEDSNAFAHQNREVRDVAKEISVALFRLVGDEVEGYLKSLRPKQLEEYQAAFEEATSAPAAKAAAPGRARANGQPQPQPRARLPDEMVNEDGGDADEDDDESVDEYTCPFCGVVDESFDSEALDQHFWAACRMLTPCKMCGQVIEVACLNEHLLGECELRKNHKECPQCGEAITARFFDKHVAARDCLPRPHPKKANRCPLCHDNVPPGKRGWRRHLLEDECPQNPRN